MAKDTSIIISAVDKTKAAFDAVKKNFSDLDRSAGRFASTIGGITGLAFTGGLSLALAKVVRETINAQNEQAQLAAVLRSTGQAAGWSQKQLNKMAAELSNSSIFSEGDITNAQTRLLSYTGIVGEQFPKAMQAVIDMAARMGMSLEQSAETIGRALDIPSQGMTALTRQGFRFTEAQKELVEQLEETGRTAEAQQIILDALNSSYGGAAVAARDTLGGALQNLQNQFDELFEAGGTGGSALAAVINTLADEISKANTQGSMLSSTFDGLVDVFAFSADAAIAAAATIRQIGRSIAVVVKNMETSIRIAALLSKGGPAMVGINAVKEYKNIQRLLDEQDAFTAAYKDDLQGYLNGNYTRFRDAVARARSAAAPVVGSTPLTAPTGGAAGGAGKVDKKARQAAEREQEALNKAILKLEERLRADAQRLADDATATELAALQRGFEAKEVTAEAYYGRLQALEEQRVATVLNGLQAERDARLRQLDAAGKESERVNIRAEISDLNTQIALAESGLERFRAEVAADLTAARTEAIKQEFAALSEAISREVDTLRVKEQQIAARVALGMSAVQGEQQVNAARRESVAVVGELTKKLEALAVANAAALGPDAGLQVERFKTELAEMSVVADQVALDVNGALNTSLRTMFSDIITGAEDAGDALQKMLKNFIDSLASIAANRAAASIFSAISGGGGGGIGGFFSGLLNGFAEGGYTGNLGTATPAGVVHGQEFVFSAPAVRALGVGALDHLHRLATGSTLPRAPRVGYSEGGEVNLPQSAAARQQSSVNIINTIDSDSLSNAIFSGGRANRSIINIISAEKQTVRSILGV